jgi:hypothetical protein
MRISSNRKKNWAQKGLSRCHQDRHSVCGDPETGLVRRVTWEINEQGHVLHGVALLEHTKKRAAIATAAEQRRIDWQ